MQHAMRMLVPLSRQSWTVVLRVALSCLQLSIETCPRYARYVHGPPISHPREARTHKYLHGADAAAGLKHHSAT